MSLSCQEIVIQNILSSSFLWFTFLKFVKTNCFGSGGGHVVSVHSFCSGDTSSNPSQVNFHFFWKERKWTKRGRGMVKNKQLKFWKALNFTQTNDQKMRQYFISLTFSFSSILFLIFKVKTFRKNIIFNFFPKLKLSPSQIDAIWESCVFRAGTTPLL